MPAYQYLQADVLDADPGLEQERGVLVFLEVERVACENRVLVRTGVGLLHVVVQAQKLYGAGDERVLLLLPPTTILKNRGVESGSIANRLVQGSPEPRY